MNVEVIAGLAGAVGLAVGLVAGLAVRVSERRSAAPIPTDPLPPGAASVLGVLDSSAVVLDETDRVLRSSPAARAFGLVDGDRLVADGPLAMARSARRDGEIRAAEVEVARGRGTRRWFSVRVAPMGPGGLVLVLAEDLTEAHRVEAIRRDFVANVSHELKTPVGALSLLAETVEDAADDPEAVRRFAGRMRHESARLINVVQDLITLSRVQGEEPPTEPEEVSLDDVVTEAIEACRLKAEPKAITLATGDHCGLRVDGDADLLVTAVRNLVDNAIAYSPDRTRVVVCAREYNERNAEISVTDQGLGIPEDELERIFERFYRVDSARSRQTGGTGLGLAIVKHVAGRHGGEVLVWSKEGAGSTFTVRLPKTNIAEHNTALEARS